MGERKEGPRFTRIVVRPGCGGGMVGINRDLLEEGMVYEITSDIFGELAIRKLGPSPLVLPYLEAKETFGFSNAADYGTLYAHVGLVLRTIAERSVPWRPSPEVIAAANTAPRGTKVRVDFGDESSWAEHLEGDVYRSLNDTFSNVELRLPDGHEHADKNGTPCNMRWGHLFIGEVTGKGKVRPVAIIGRDLSPVIGKTAPGAEAAEPFVDTGLGGVREGETR